MGLHRWEGGVIHGQRDLQQLRDQLQKVPLDKEHLEEEIHTLNVQNNHEVQRLQCEMKHQTEHFKKEIEQINQIIKDQREML